MVWTRKVMVVGLVFALLVAVLDGGLAVWAQTAGAAEAARDGVPFYGYPLAGHVLAMVILAACSVAASLELARRGAWTLAVLLAVGVTAGPMGVVAVPVHRALVASDADTAVWWHLVVGGLQLAILLAAAWAIARILPASRSGPVSRRETAWFVVVAAGAATLQVLASQGIEEEPQLQVILGWSVLAAALAVLARRGRWAPAALSVAALVLMYLAYSRPGGWPGVAGWDWFAQAPVVLAWTTPVVLLSCPAALAVGRLAQVVLARVALSRVVTPAPPV